MTPTRIKHLARASRLCLFAQGSPLCPSTFSTRALKSAKGKPRAGWAFARRCNQRRPCGAELRPQGTRVAGKVAGGLRILRTRVRPIRPSGRLGAGHARPVPVAVGWGTGPQGSLLLPQCRVPPLLTRGMLLLALGSSWEAGLRLGGKRTVLWAAAALRGFRAAASRVVPCSGSSGLVGCRSAWLRGASAGSPVLGRRVRTQVGLRKACGLSEGAGWRERRARGLWCGRSPLRGAQRLPSSASAASASGLGSRGLWHPRVQECPFESGHFLGGSKSFTARCKPSGFPMTLNYFVFYL